MSTALKKLKKLKGKSVKQSNLQLQALKSTRSSVSHHREASQNTNRALEELRGVAKDACTAAMIEMATPFKPLLSWLNEGNAAISFTAANDRVLEQAQPEVTRQPTNFQAKAPFGNSPSFRPDNKLSLARIPFKSPACKRCPALTGGLCKCAKKRLSA